MAEETAAVPTKETPAAPQEKIEFMDAVQGVLRQARAVDGVRRGLHECAKVLDKGTARLCLLAADCDEPAIVKLVRALADGHNTRVVEVPMRTQLGQWCGLYKLDEEGNPRKIVKTSVAVITDYGEPTPELNALLQHLKGA